MLIDAVSQAEPGLLDDAFGFSPGRWAQHSLPNASMSLRFTQQISI